MRDLLLLSIHFLYTLFKLLKPGGVRAVMAENLALKQQLITLNRRNKRSPKLTSFDRFFYGLLAFIIGEHRIHKIGVILKTATILKFHRALMKEKFHNLFSNKSKKKAGRKPLSQAAIDLIIEMKKRNPMIGYGRISMQIFETFGITISRFSVGRILRLYKHKLPFDGGPSWLTFIGQIKDSLWSVDLFRCESISLKSH